MSWTKLFFFFFVWSAIKFLSHLKAKLDLKVVTHIEWRLRDVAWILMIKNSFLLYFGPVTSALHEVYASVLLFPFLMFILDLFFFPWKKNKSCYLHCSFDSFSLHFINWEKWILTFPPSSVTVVVAYLMKTREMSLSEALQHVKSRRPLAAPNPGFIRQLEDFEKLLQGGFNLH